MAFDPTKRPTPPPAKAPAKAKQPTPTQNAKRNAREEGVNGLFQLGTMLCMMTGQHADAQAFATHGPKISPEIAKIAEDYDKVGEAIDRMVAVGPFAGLLTAVLPLALQLAVNHGKGNAAMFADFGVVSRETMHANGNAAVMRQAAAAMEAQRAAEQEFVAAQIAVQNSAAAANGRTDDLVNA